MIASTQSNPSAYASVPEYHRYPRQTIMNANEEKELARKILQSRYELWLQLISDYVTIDDIGTYISDAAENMVSGGHQRASRFNKNLFDKLSISCIEYRNRPLISSKNEMIQCRMAVAKNLAEFDPCADVARKLMVSINSKRVAKHRRRRFDLYIGRVENAWREYTTHRDVFMQKNIPLVSMVARKYRTYGIPIEDLIQEGVFGLQKAIGLYDPDVGTKFSTYAVWWIRATLSRYCQNHARMVRLPVALQDRMGKFNDAIEKLRMHGKPTSDDEISKISGLQVKTIKRLRRISTTPSVSIDSAGNDGRGLSDVLIDESNDYDTIDIISDSKILLEIIKSMPDTRDAMILHRRFGIEGKGWTLQEIGDDLGMSRERVRQIESSALDYLRRALLRKRNMKMMKL